ncbi:hypothetical protein ACSVBT_17355 [Afipia sp. TerB]
MANNVKEFIDFWIKNSVHAAEPLGTLGGEQDVDELVRRLLEMGEDQGLTTAEMQAEVGPLDEYIRAKLKVANETDSARPKR